MKRSLTASLFACLALAGSCRCVVAQEAEKPFYLHDGDRVVFYGDSITEQRMYTYWTEVYTATRFPSMRVEFFAAGIGGDRVSGGIAGPVDVRLPRDVFAQKPTVVTIMLGMNDGAYQPLNKDIEKTYTDGYEHILTSIHEHLPGARLTLLGPSPYDEVTRNPELVGYNETMVRFSEIDRELATKHGGTFVDFNAPFVAALKRGMALNPLATQLLVPDRVHPEALAHWFMASALLKGWNAPALVASTAIDAAKGTLIETRNSHVSNLTATADSVRWTELDDALPLPLDDHHVGNHFLRSLIPIDEELNQEPLRITGLQPGSFQLKIDAAVVGTFSSAELAKGINLALYNTPMRGQAYQVGWQVRDRDETHFVRMRMLMNEQNTGLSAEPGATDLAAFERVQQKKIDEAAQPRPHDFELKALPTQQTVVTPPSIGDAPADAGPLATDLSSNFDRKDVAHALRKVADWQLARMPGNLTQDWTAAALYAGFMAVPDAVNGDAYRKAMRAMGEQFAWQLGPRAYHADDHAIGQTYLELYESAHDSAMLAPTRTSMDALMKRSDDPAKPLWWWCDALFMAPPVLARLSKITGDPRYLDYMNREWWITSKLLYDPALHLYARDATYLEKHEANGARLFWSRGNGWVMAGLVRVLETMPTNYASRPRYVAQFKEMAKAVAALQGADGLWRPGLLDAAAYPLPEVSGSAFFTCALAWGVRTGLLDRKEYLPVVKRAWTGLLAHIYQDGRLGSIQPIGAAPDQYGVSASYVYGVGAFLLAGSEAHNLAAH